MATIFLVRHGETDWNRSGQIMGARPVPLNQTGEAQARGLAQFLKRRSTQHDGPLGPVQPVLRFPPFAEEPCHLLSSPVHRALQTAHVLGHALGLTVQTEAGLSEIGVGAWEGRYWDDLGDDPSRRQYYSHPSEARPPGGETFHEVQSRAIAVVNRILEQRARGTFILVSHADVIRSIIAHSLDLQPRQTRAMRIDHTSLTGISLSPGPPALLFLNYLAVDLE
jgi:broad specificity phosphatase PhoE